MARYDFRRILVTVHTLIWPYGYDLAADEEGSGLFVLDPRGEDRGAK